jgi:hypothetical protein
LVNASEVDLLKEWEDNYTLRCAVWEAEKAIQDEVLATRYEKSEQCSKAVAKNKKLLELFDAPIYVDEIDNKYWGDHSHFRKIPWFIVTTKIGRFIIGWRKRVISIDWSDTRGTKTSKELFADENVTKDTKMIHAWSMDDARRYINTIITNKALNQGVNNER